VVLALLLLAAGLYAAARARLDVFPDFAPPQVVVQTEAPGLSPAEVEQLVTLPIESALNGLPRLDTLRSESIQGLSVVTVIFQDGTDVYRARQQVGERLAELAGQLPEGVKVPRMAPLTSSTGRLLTVGFTSGTASPFELRDVAQGTVRPRLLAVPGVAQVVVHGGDVRQFQVRVDPDLLAARRLTLADVLDATRQAGGVRGAGFLENDRQRLTLRVEAQVRSARELGDTAVVSAEGTPVKLRDVAQVVEGPEPKFGDAAVTVGEDEGDPALLGEPAVLLIVFKQLDADTVEVTRRIEAELERLRPLLAAEGVRYHPRLFRQANLIEHAVGNVAWSLLIGAILVSVVLFLFLFNLRTAFISLTAIPLSLLSAVLVLWAFGVSLNTLTLGGLAIAVGEVVDDAIIDVENIYRRLRENARLEHPRPAAAVVLAASLEVRSAVVYATFIVVLVFVPVFFLSGLQGRLFAPLGHAYVLAVLASLATALTVTPALAMVLLPRPVSRLRLSAPDLQSRERLGGEPVLLRWLQSGYDRLLRWLDGALGFALLLTVTALLVVAAGWAVSQCGGAFLPELRENHFVVHMRGLPGTSLPQSLATGKQVSAALQGDDVRSIAQQVGRAELGEDTWGVEYSELEVDLRATAGEDIEQTQRRLRQKLRDFAGFSFEVMPFLTERIKETLTGTPAPVAVKIYGDDLPALDRAARDVARALAAVPGADNVRPEPTAGVPELVVRVRPRDAARYGVRGAHVRDAVHAAYQGADGGQVYDRNRVIDLVVLLDPRLRGDPDAVANLWLDVPAPREGEAPAEPKEKSSAGASPSRKGTGRVQLKQVADVFLSDGRFRIAHEGGTRRQVVTCYVQRRDVASFAADAQRRLAGLDLPPGTYAVLTGEHEAQQAARWELLLLSLAAGVGILLLLWLVFRSAGRLLLVVVNLPFALVGGVAAVYLAGGVLDVGSLIGFVTLFGISTRNGIMMVSHWQHLHEAEGVPWGPDLVFRGARERLAPVLMTALVTGLGLLPIALGAGEAGREIEGPMARVILGGLVTSTALNLLVLPVLYRRFGGPSRAVGRPD
jgi:CzcA family heavy metal efflux pump